MTQVVTGPEPDGNAAGIAEVDGDDASGSMTMVAILLVVCVLLTLVVAGVHLSRGQHKPDGPVFNKTAVLVMNPAANFTTTDRIQPQARSGPAIYHQSSAAAEVSDYDEPLSGNSGDGELYYSEPFAEPSPSAEAVYSVVGGGSFHVPDGSYDQPPLPDDNYAPPGPVNLNMYHEIGGVNDYLAPMALAAGAQADDARYANADAEEEAAAYYSTIDAADPNQRNLGTNLVPAKRSFQASGTGPERKASVYDGFGGAGSADAIYAEAEDESGFTYTGDVYEIPNTSGAAMSGAIYSAATVA